MKITSALAFVNGFLLTGLLFNACKHGHGHPENAQHFDQLIYIDGDPPGIVPEVFAPGVVSSPDHVEFGIAFSQNGKEFYFSRTVEDSGHIFQMKWTGDTWDGPFKMKFADSQYISEPHLAGEGNTLLFTELVVDQAAPQKMEPYISAVRREGNKWSASEKLWKGMYASMSENKNIYYTNIEQQTIERRVFEADYASPEVLHFNGMDFPVSHPCIAPDESFIIFGGFNPAGQAGGQWADLYISFKNENGTFGKAANLGDSINNQYPNICPSISPDSKYLFYSNKGDIYWVDMEVLKNRN